MSHVHYFFRKYFYYLDLEEARGKGKGELLLFYYRTVRKFERERYQLKSYILYLNKQFFFRFNLVEFVDSIF